MASRDAAGDNVVAFRPRERPAVGWPPREMLTRLEAAGTLVLGPGDAHARTVAAGLAMVGFARVSAIVPGGEPVPLRASEMFVPDDRSWRVEPGELYRPRA